MVSDKEKGKPLNAKALYCIKHEAHLKPSFYNHAMSKKGL